MSALSSHRPSIRGTCEHRRQVDVGGPDRHRERLVVVLAPWIGTGHDARRGWWWPPPPVTVDTVSTRCDGVGREGRVLRAEGATGLGDDQVGAELRPAGPAGAPLALSVRPTAHTMAATPMTGPSMMRRVRTLRAVSPVQATSDQVARLAHAGRPVSSSATMRPSRMETVALCRVGHRRVVGHHHHRPLRRLEAREDLEHVGGVGRVEGAGRLVGQDHERLGHDGPGQRHPLLLTPRHLHRSVVGPGSETEPVEGPAGPLPALPSAGCPGRAARSRRCRARSGGGSGGTAGRRIRWSRPGVASGSGSSSALTSWPATRTVPDVGRSSTPSRPSMVDLPEPEGPTIDMNSPGMICSDTSRSA